VKKMSLDSRILKESVDVGSLHEHLEPYQFKKIIPDTPLWLSKSLFNESPVNSKDYVFSLGDIKLLTVCTGETDTGYSFDVVKVI